MRITDFPSEALTEVRFLNAGRRAGQFYEDRLPVHHARVDALPDDLDAIVVTADLQGRERFQEAKGGPPRLLGDVLPGRLVETLLPRVGVTDPDRVGVLLAGDFYTVPALDRRGGSGDVTSVWNTFADTFAWVAGVAGNHDTFGEHFDERPRLPRCAKFLDEESTEFSGLRIGGLGGIVGNPGRPRRRTEEDYLLAYEILLENAPDVVVSHDGPRGPQPGQLGSSAVRELLERGRRCLVVRGHAHWKRPLGELANGTQILNVDCRCAVLTR